MTSFDGVKVALRCGNSIVVIQRDNKPGLRFAGMWDLPGGGRESNETPFECAAREVVEELHISIKPTSIAWQKLHPAMHDPSLHAYFIVAIIKKSDVDGIIFGNEGQGWRLMPIDNFMRDPNVIEDLKTTRMQPYLNSL